MIYATLACLGPDSQTFLQGQLSCDMRHIKPDALTLACYCNIKGRVIAAPYIYSVPDGFHLIVPQDVAHALLTGLGKVIVFSKATLKDVTHDIPAIPTFHQPRYEIVPGAGFSPSSLEPASHEAWMAHLIAHKIPTIALAQSGAFLPHDVGLVDLGAVSFTKGCYLGQEIIARMHYKAARKKHLVSLINAAKIEGDLVNEVIFEGKRYTLVVQLTGTD